MKSVSEVLHRTPWWALIFGGLATLVALAVFVTPYHIIRYRDDSKSAEESRAIKREIDNTFAENAINLGRGVLKGMIARTTDPQRRVELEEALRGLEEARSELRTMGAEILGAKRAALEEARDALRTTRDASKEIRQALREAQREAKGAQGAEVPAAQANVKGLEQALREAESEVRAAEAREREARRTLRRAERGVKIDIGPADKPTVQIEIDPSSPPATPPAPAEGAEPPAPPDGKAITLPPLPPEVATKIRRDVTGDMYRIGIGAALILVLLPLFIVAVVVKFFADRSRASQRLAEVKRKEADYARMTQQVTEAKLSALQAQVEPHFLYNTLASVQALTEVDPARASEMTGHLIHYLRNALPKMRESVSTVGQEVELARAYLNILQMRMGKRLAFEIDVPAELAETPFPPLMLPSLVENAIKHGLEPQREGGQVRISARVQDGRVRLVVEDTGRGFSETPGAGVGLANIRERLAALYGDKAHLVLEANQPHGVVATIDVPAAGTGSAASAAATAARIETPPPGAGTTPAPEPVRVAAAGFWPRTWEVVVGLERVWRKIVYYLFLALLMVAGVAAVGLLVAILVGAIPVMIGDDLFTGPMGALIGLAGAVIGFIAVAAALAIVMLVLYGLGFLIVGVAIFTGIVVLIGLSPVLAPIALLGLLIWWLVKRSRAQAPPTEPPRVEPTMAEGGR